MTETIISQEDLNELEIPYNIPDGHCLKVYFESDAIETVAKVILFDEKGDSVKESKTCGYCNNAEEVFNGTTGVYSLLFDALTHRPFI